MGKKIIFLIVISFLVTLCSDGGTDTVFYVKNNSGHSVKLSIFNVEIQSKSWVKDTTYVLPNLSEINNTVSLKGHGYAMLPFGNPDSAYIVFDNSLIIMFKRNDPNIRNVLNFDSYTGGKKEDNLYEFTYTITEDDYKNAKPIK